MVYSWPCVQSTNAYAKPKSTDALKKANEAYLKRDYSQALRLYRAYLRKKNKDYNAWTLLAATYYHRAQPKRALKILLRFKKKTSLTSQSKFYIGLSYDVIGKLQSARKYLRAASKHDDAFGALATFELFAIQYEEFNIKSARRWLKVYEKRFPKGAYIDIVKEYSRQLDEQKILTIRESARHVYRRDYYSNHPSSFFPFEHSWAFQLGWKFNLERNPEPRLDPDAPLKQAQVPEYAAFTKLSLGIGPFRTGESKIWLAYNYIQNWFTDENRLKFYLDNIIDFTYFPLRPDLLRRQHQLSADFETPITRSFTLGVFSQIEFNIAGSSLYPVTERPEISESQDISTKILFVPEVRWRIDSQHKLSLYSLFEKYIDIELTELSYQSFKILDIKNFFISLGLGHRFELPKYTLNVSTDAFYLSYIYNDDFEDHSTLGLNVIADKKLWDIKLALRAYLHQDDYEKPSIQQYECSPSSANSDVLDEAIECKRSILTMGGDAGLSYTFFEKHTVYSTVSFLTSSSATNEVYNRIRFAFIAGYSIGFPDERSSLRFLDAYKKIDENYEGLLP